MLNSLRMCLYVLSAFIVISGLNGQGVDFIIDGRPGNGGIPNTNDQNNIPMGRHHIIPFSTLRDFWDAVLGQIGNDATFFSVVFGDIFTTMADYVEGADNVERTTQFLTHFGTQAITHDLVGPYVDPGGATVLTLVQSQGIIDYFKQKWSWTRGNIFIGPREDYRCDDPHSHFEIHVDVIIGTARQKAMYKMYKSMRAFIDNPGSTTKHRTNCKKIVDDYKTNVLVEELTVYLDYQWKPAAMVKYKLKDATTDPGLIAAGCTATEDCSGDAPTKLHRRRLSRLYNKDNQYNQHNQYKYNRLYDLYDLHNELEDNINNEKETIEYLQNELNEMAIHEMAIHEMELREMEMVRLIQTDLTYTQPNPANPLNNIINQPRPIRSYCPSLKWYTSDFSKSADEQEPEGKTEWVYIVGMTYHRIIPFSTLQRFFDDVIASNHYALLVPLFRVFSGPSYKIKKTKGVVSGILLKSEQTEITQAIEQITNIGGVVAAHTVRDQQARAGLTLIHQLIAYLPGNVFVGPRNVHRTDRTTNFDGGSLGIVGTDDFNVLQGVDNLIIAYLNAIPADPQRALDITAIVNELKKLAAKKSVYAFDSANWSDIPEKLYMIKVTTTYDAKVVGYIQDNYNLARAGC